MENFLNKRIENYIITSLLGKGGMGAVYKAYDEYLHRYVAIKIIESSYDRDGGDVTERFKVEARNHAQLIHHNIATIYGFVEFDNRFGIVMEYIDGESLESVIEKNRRLHILDVVYLTNQLLDGIGYAHSKGYIHRDIKPSNIVVNRDGIVKVLDFGISKYTESNYNNTETGSMIGTIDYMSPEQIRGRNINRTSDIYSIGCTIYDMLVGVPPFNSRNKYDVLEGHLNKTPSKIYEFSSNSEQGIDYIIQKMLRKNQIERYQSCNSAKEDLKLYENLLKSSESHYFVSQKTTKKPVKKKSHFGMFFLFIILFIAFSIFIYFEIKEIIQFQL